MQNTIKVEDEDVYFILQSYHDSIVGVHLEDALHLMTLMVFNTGLVRRK